MSLQSLIGLGFTVSIFLGVLAVGMRVAPADLHYLRDKPARLVRSLLAMNLAAPFVAVMVCKTFALHPAVSLVTLAIAPVGALFSQAMLPLVALGHYAFARGLFFTSIVLSVVLTPLAVEVIQVIFGGDVHVDPLTVAKVVVGSVLLPLGIGFAIAQWWPAAKRWNSAIQTVSSLVLAVCSVTLLAVAWSHLGSVIREGTLTATRPRPLSRRARGGRPHRARLGDGVAASRRRHGGREPRRSAAGADRRTSRPCSMGLRSGLYAGR